jgi:hypothetical protein
MATKAGCLWIFLFICHAGFGQRSVQGLFNEFSKAAAAEQVNAGKMTMTFAGLFAETMGVESIEIINLASCADEVKADFAQAIRELKDDAFETLVNTSENGKRVKILLRIRDDIIREAAILSSGPNPAMIRLRGRIKSADLEKVIEGHRK